MSIRQIVDRELVIPVNDNRLARELDRLGLDRNHDNIVSPADFVGHADKYESMHAAVANAAVAAGVMTKLQGEGFERFMDRYNDVVALDQVTTEWDALNGTTAMSIVRWLTADFYAAEWQNLVLPRIQKGGDLSPPALCSIAQDLAEAVMMLANTTLLFSFDGGCGEIDSGGVKKNMPSAVYYNQKKIPDFLRSSVRFLAEGYTNSRDWLVQFNVFTCVGDSCPQYDSTLMMQTLPLLQGIYVGLDTKAEF